ncbi:MAG: hypothetical protein EXR95_08820 [Gemmatimonadetes bacterium]|nr:hypothetical protein [Gemmatimonadota bacterium]
MSSASNDNGPGVPEALPRTLAMVVDRLGAEGIDRLWIFPPMIRGRREWGLVAVSVFSADGERRRLHTAPYTAERTGQGLVISHDLHEQGEAPPDRIPRVMSGVVHRSPEELGEPREVVVEGNAETIAELMAEFDPAMLEPTPS